MEGRNTKIKLSITPEVLFIHPSAPQEDTHSPIPSHTPISSLEEADLTNPNLPSAPQEDSPIPSNIPISSLEEANLTHPNHQEDNDSPILSHTPFSSIEEATNRKEPKSNNNHFEDISNPLEASQWKTPPWPSPLKTDWHKDIDNIWEINLP